MSTDGWLPPGVTDADIDRAAPGYDEPPCKWVEDSELGVYCSYCGAVLDEECEWERGLNAELQKDYDEERESGWSV